MNEFTTVDTREDLIEKVSNLQGQVNQLRQQREVGNVLGGLLRTDIAPGLIPIGPYRQDVDASFSLEFTLWIPEEVLRIRRMTLHLTPKPSRLAAGVIAANDAQTSEAEGSTPVNVSAANHNHIWLSHVSDTPIHTGTQVPTTTAQPTGTVNVGTDLHTHVETGGVTGVPSNTVPVGSQTHVHSAVNVTVPSTSNFLKFGTYDEDGAADGTRVFDIIGANTPSDHYTTAAQSGDVSVADAEHTHEVPGHTHDITLEISEQGMADDLEIIIDGVNRTAALGGPWTAASDIELDLNDLILVGFNNARNEPVTGPHTIEVTSSAEGAVEVVGDYYVIVKAVQ